MTRFSTYDTAGTASWCRRRTCLDIKCAVAPLILLIVALAPLPASAQTTELVSVAPDGAIGNFDSFTGTVSADGRFVAFISSADNLVGSDTNGFGDAFVRDRLNNTTELVSVSTGGAQGNKSSASPAISADGRFVAFASNATNLVAGDTNNRLDVFFRDRQIGVTERLSIASDGTQANSDSGSLVRMSADGRYVVFSSRATSLVTGDTNGREDVFTRDQQAGVTERVSIASDGAQANADAEGVDVSDDGRFVAFSSAATNLVVSDTNGANDAFVRDRLTGTTERISLATGGAQANGGSTTGGTVGSIISADGRFITFSSDASNLVNSDNNGLADVFVRDRLTGTTEIVSVATGGEQANYTATALRQGGISADGRFVAFISGASNLVRFDDNGYEPDVFVRDRLSDTTEKVSVAAEGVEECEGGMYNTLRASISDDGRFVSFDNPRKLVAAVPFCGYYEQVFLRDRGPEVSYTFIGFDSPLENLPFTNSSKAGSAIPIKWQVADQDGNFVNDLGTVGALQFAPVACDSQDFDYENLIPEEALAAGASDVHYEKVTDQFGFAWKTEKSKAGTCAVFILTLQDGQQQFARFMLK